MITVFQHSEVIVMVAGEDGTEKLGDGKGENTVRNLGWICMWCCLKL